MKNTLKASFLFCVLFLSVTSGQAQPKPDFVVIVKENNIDNKPIQNATVTVTRSDPWAPVKVQSLTNQEGIAYITVTGTGRKFLGEFTVSVTKIGFDDYSMTYSPSGTESMPVQLEFNLYRKDAVKLKVEVHDFGVEPLEEAAVTLTRVGEKSPFAGSLTEKDGTATLTIPPDKLKGTIQLKVTATDFQDDIRSLEASSLETLKDPLRIRLKRHEGDSRFVGTWKVECNIEIILNGDMTGSWVDHRNGPAKSMYESGKFEGTWSSNGDEATLVLTKAPLPERENRLGPVVLKLEKGRLLVPYCGYGSK